MPRGIATPATYADAIARAELIAEIRSYNAERPHHGRWCYGNTPLQTFFDSLELAKEKLFAA